MVRRERLARRIQKPRDEEGAMTPFAFFSALMLRVVFAESPHRSQKRASPTRRGRTKAGVADALGDVLER